MHKLVVAALATSAALAASPASLAGKPPKPPPSSQATKPPPGEKQPPKQRPSASPSPLKQADAVCRTGLREREAMLAAVQKKPSATARQTLLRILAGEVRVEARMLVGLGAVKPAGKARAGYSRALALFRLRQAQDTVLVARLRQRWDARALERRLREDRATNGRLARLFSDLESNDCADYFLVARGSQPASSRVSRRNSRSARSEAKSSSSRAAIRN